MKKIGPLLLILFVSLVANAQITPQPSPGASISQTIGVTEIYLEYSRPSVKGRKVFGDLVPFEKVWRTGANASTKFEVSNAVQINGMDIKPGVYSLMTRPGASVWEVYLLNDLDVTEQTFDFANVVYRFLAKTSKIDFAESFTIIFTDLTDETANLKIRWEKTELILSIKVNNLLPVENAIEIKTDEMAGNFQQAAEYFLQKNENTELALQYIEKSIVLRETFRNYWIKAQLLYAQKRFRESLTAATKAKEMGLNDPVYELFSESVNATITDLKKKVL